MKKSFKLITFNINNFCFLLILSIAVYSFFFSSPDPITKTECIAHRAHRLHHTCTFEAFAICEYYLHKVGYIQNWILSAIKMPSCAHIVSFAFEK